MGEKNNNLEFLANDFASIAAAADKLVDICRNKDNPLYGHYNCTQIVMQSEFRYYNSVFKKIEDMSAIGLFILFSIISCFVLYILRRFIFENKNIFIVMITRALIPPLSIGVGTGVVASGFESAVSLDPAIIGFGSACIAFGVAFWSIRPR